MRLAKPLLIATFALVLAVSAGAGSVDFGGSLFNLTGVGNSSGVSSTPGSTTGFVQEDALKGWFQANFNPNLTFNFQLDATFNTAPILPFNTTLLYLNADLLNLHGSYPFTNGALKLLQFTVGRLMLADFTTLVVSHEVDGVLLDFEFPAVSVNVSAGYTGLVTKGASTIEVSKADLNDFANTGVYFASPRLVELVQASLLVIPGQRISLSAILQQDLRGTPLDLADGSGESLISAGSTTLNASQGGLVNTQYFGLGMSGSIVGKLTYDVFTYLETGQELAYQGVSYQNLFFFGLLSGGGVRLLLPTALSSIITAHVYFASGDANAGTVTEGATQSFSVFTPISRPILDNVFSPQLSNLVVLEASYSLKPLSGLGEGLPQKIQTSLQADVYLRPTQGAISEPGVPAGTGPYLGTETDLAVTFTPFSDFGASVWGGLFFPGSAFASGSGTQYKAGLDFSLTF
jgi:hypothetical protein